MSRLAKKPIIMPEKTEVKLSGNTLFVKGPLGELERAVRPNVEFVIEGREVKIAPRRNDMETKALVGTYASHLKNMIKGVNEAFSKKLILEGIGFKSDVKGANLNLALGYSHPVVIAIPPKLKVTAEKNVITVSGSDKEAVGSFASKVRSLKKAEPYLGKGFRYEGEVVRRKEGKKAA